MPKHSIRLAILAIFVLIQLSSAQAGKKRFSKADTLAGSLSPERTCFDVQHYDIQLRLNIEEKSIRGRNRIRAMMLRESPLIQIDLAAGLKILSISSEGKALPYTRSYNAVFIKAPQAWKPGPFSLDIEYSGKPQEAVKPPWDDGFIWGRDPSGNPWLGVTCEGLGASSWWPCKDHLSDEPDSVRLTIEAPDTLQAISNGRQLDTHALPGRYQSTTWATTYPINTYNVTFYVGKYAHFSDEYISAADGDTLSLNYYVLPENLAKAKLHFEQTKGMLACYEQLLDKYPFWRDGFQLIETSYLGMEHQSAIAYGNQYKRGYLGSRITPALNFDFIIIHESGHEYFGNSISCTDPAEMWLHESFTTYLETMYIYCHDGYERAMEYLRMQKAYIKNQEPMAGPMHVNFHDFMSSDHYYKGAWMLHSIGKTFASYEDWLAFLKNYYRTFAYQSVSGADFIRFLESETGRDWKAFFRQYLEKPFIPQLTYTFTQQEKGLILRYRYTNTESDFSYPLQLRNKNGKTIRVQPKSEWEEIAILGTADEDWAFDEDVLIDFIQSKP